MGPADALVEPTPIIEGPLVVAGKLLADNRPGFATLGLDTKLVLVAADCGLIFYEMFDVDPISVW